MAELITGPHLPWFPFLFAEAKGAIGSSGKAKLQCWSILRIALGLLKSLYDRARAADPDACAPWTDDETCVVRLVTSEVHWELWIMRMDVDTGAYVSPLGMTG